MKEYRGFKYSITAGPNGLSLFAVWSADANSRREDPIYVRICKRQADGERVVKKWIDERRPRRRRQRSRPKRLGK